MPDGYMDPDKIVDEQEGSAPAEAKEKREPRQQGSIAFSYVDLGEAISVARALLDLGAVPVDRDQLAAKLGMKLSGAFINRTSAARLFGLTELGSGKFQLTQLGRAILDDHRAAAAKADAFLRVQLHRRIYDEFRNEQLPPSPDGLEKAITSFGVPPKQKDKARRAFENSAEQAGFFAHGKDRLVAPVIPTPWNAPLGEQAQSKNDETKTETVKPLLPLGDGKDHTITLPPAAEHPFIAGLLLSLPKLGEVWAAESRVKWLKTAIDAFELMYEGSGRPIMVTQADPALLAWTGVVQLLAIAEPSSVTPKMLLSMLAAAWLPPSDSDEQK